MELFSTRGVNRNVFHVAGPWDAFRVLVIFWGFYLWQLNLCFSLSDVVVSEVSWAAVLTTLQEAGSWWTQSRRAITDSSGFIWITTLPSFCHLFSYTWMPRINTKLYLTGHTERCLVRTSCPVCQNPPWTTAAVSLQHHTLSLYLLRRDWSNQQFSGQMSFLTFLTRLASPVVS